MRAGGRNGIGLGWAATSTRLSKSRVTAGRRMQQDSRGISVLVFATLASEQEIKKFVLQAGQLFGHWRGTCIRGDQTALKPAIRSRLCTSVTLAASDKYLEFNSVVPLVPLPLPPAPLTSFYATVRLSRWKDRRRGRKVPRHHTTGNGHVRHSGK